MKINNFFFVTINILLNNYFYQFVILLFFLKGDFVSISEITFLLAPLIFLKEAYSSNQRTLLLSDKKKKLFKIFLKQRILYSILIIVFYLIFIFYFSKIENISLIFLLVILVNLMWINELNLTQLESSLNKKKISRNLVYLALIYLFFSYFLFNLDLNLTLIILSILVIFIIKNIFKNYKELYLFFKNIKIKYSLNFKFLSTLSINFVNLIWRISFYFLLEKEYAGILFGIFAFMSFPSSLYNNTIGISLEIQNKFKVYFKFFLIIYYLIILTLMTKIYFNSIVPSNDPQLINFSLLAGLLSFLGSIIMCFSISKRIKTLNYQKLKRNKLFLLDVIYAFINLLSLVIIYFVFGANYFSILFLTSAIFSLVYFIYSKNLYLNLK